MWYKRTDGWWFEWNGSKTVNVYRQDGTAIVDCFSLDYGRSDFSVGEVANLCDEWSMEWL